MLQLIFQTPPDAAVLARIGAGDDVVFLDGAVLGLLKNSRWVQEISRLTGACQVFALADDLQIRGLAQADLVAGLALVDYAGLVALTIKNTVTQSWS
ncbi:sulfurtransferase complex subunit TusB [Methylovulum psychrotolerans]|uniref:Sulfurtransferase complex subunit TusB n=1 Tax=Methylovulum psychrotolerans TaxID=1704499 RepID=A0A1Z4BV96_9GAMM|nr:sulfurtransferase complex subunit TusB [Methylovulum psychrotolerans]ASF45170.1 sulfurtransferase complex subunit TusB [Methylovulum psychrotolerans]